MTPPDAPTQPIAPGDYPPASTAPPKPAWIPARNSTVTWIVGLALAAVLGIVGLVTFLNDTSEGPIRAARWSERLTDWARGGPDLPSPAEWDRKRDTNPTPPPALALSLELGYKIDQL